jgi:hypothetical protein
MFIHAFYLSISDTAIYFEYGRCLPAPDPPLRLPVAHALGRPFFIFLNPNGHFGYDVLTPPPPPATSTTSSTSPRQRGTS